MEKKWISNIFLDHFFITLSNQDRFYFSSNKTKDDEIISSIKTYVLGPLITHCTVNHDGSFQELKDVNSNELMRQITCEETGKTKHIP